MSSSSGEHFLLDEQVCFALYAASRAVTDVYRPLLNELGLTYPQYLVLLVLWERDSRSIKDIGEALHLDYGTISPLLKRLETAGLVTRHRLASDERTVSVTLTEAGEGLRERVTGIPPVIGCAIGLDDGPRRDLIRTLKALTASALAISTTQEAPNAQP
ncbi:MAG: MarR family transcriptional regulator [Amycolatopsis sp.]|jgi:DNA-binding MarR family transcriptional regulator|uniref:MarR family winged helix-turn-helix transcriptional regulator n=1 Tax=Amycolatopsis sp. TaxID=37632 RepID=UPI00261D89E3|nr:MarR family winged helix-turn-helix transcriptional regulator [Amycolatopsis sp.]MCU1680477.1 MarR family transcriptional regulator [Amycolatopsis sp.]